MLKWWTSDGYPTRFGYLVMIATLAVLEWLVMWRGGEDLARVLGAE